ncbi:MAG: adenylate/guanylate cyclase domain-containing protein [Magnetococcales bacterium]|nr:adenylate/guanylate cyclase domain-containing protein [Magnetococcales bacterium]
MANTKTVTEMAIMFVDMPGSLHLYGQIDEGHARNMVSEYLEIIRTAIRTSQGTVYKEIGEELLCTFPTAEDAARAAVQIQENCKRRFGEKRLGVRVVFHLGMAIIDGEVLVGESVNVATILIGFAKEDQILLSGTAHDKLFRSKSETRFVSSFPIRGRSKPLEVHELVWGDDATVTEADPNPMPKSHSDSPMVRLIHGTLRRWVNAEHPVVTLGRMEKNDNQHNQHIQLLNDLASRKHAEFIFRDGQFFLVDSSTNGVSFITQQGKLTYIHRSEMAITENGVIGVGKQSPCEESGVVVTFVDVS